MATLTITTDDIDGSREAETVSFSYNHVQYEIDLSIKNKKMLETVLAPYIDKARRSGMASRPTRRQPTAVAVNYRDLDNIGLEHRGKVTADEARLVRENLDRANANRAREGQGPIDVTDPKMVKRYGL